MDKLRKYLNGLPVAEQGLFARRCGTSIGYLRKAISAGQALAEKTCIAIDRESGGAVKCEDLRSDVDWGYLRGTQPVFTDGPHPRSKPSLLPESGQEAKCGCQTAELVSNGAQAATGAPVQAGARKTAGSECQGVA